MVPVLVPVDLNMNGYGDIGILSNLYFLLLIAKRVLQNFVQLGALNFRHAVILGLLTTQKQQ